jgi:hypothetical protein
MIYFIEKTSNNDYKIINLEGENIIDIHKLNEKIYSFSEKDIVIHDMTELQETVCKSYNVLDYFGCDWNAFNLLYSYNEYVSNSFEFDTYNEQISFKDLIKNALSNQSYFGENSMFESFSVDFNKFYDFLKIQNFPNSKKITKLSLDNIDLSYSSKDNWLKFIFALHGYEGFVVCNELETEDPHLDSLNILSHNNQLLIPFNLFSYLNKYQEIKDFKILEIYITSRKKYIEKGNKKDKINKFFNYKNLSQNQDPLTQLYVRYYFFIFSLKYFPEELLAIDLKKKLMYSYDPDLEHPYFKHIEIS